MKVRFWGVRGSCPTPLTPDDIKNKISAVLNRVKEKDIQSSTTKEKFLSSLPSHLFGTAGGNTACVELRLIDNNLLVFDCGSGLRELYNHLKRRNEERSIKHYHIFLSHFHYDHLLGLPYFPPMYDKDVKISFYSPFASMEKILRSYLRKPYHPVGFEVFAAQFQFHILNREPLTIGCCEIQWIKRNHPDGTIAYRIKEGNRVLIYSTDTELEESNFRMTRRNRLFFKKADMIILDSQYTLKEAIDKRSWGHSSFSLAIDFANVFQIGALYLFHHEPMNNDKDVEQIERLARSYQSHQKMKHNGHRLNIQVAREGKSVEL